MVGFCLNLSAMYGPIPALPGVFPEYRGRKETEQVFSLLLGPPSYALFFRSTLVFVSSHTLSRLGVFSGFVALFLHFFVTYENIS